MVNRISTIIKTNLPGSPKPTAQEGIPFALEQGPDASKSVEVNLQAQPDIADKQSVARRREDDMRVQKVMMNDENHDHWNVELHDKFLLRNVGRDLCKELTTTLSVVLVNERNLSDLRVQLVAFEKQYSNSSEILAKVKSKPSAEEEGMLNESTRAKDFIAPETSPELGSDSEVAPSDSLTKISDDGSASQDDEIMIDPPSDVAENDAITYMAKADESLLKINQIKHEISFITEKLQQLDVDMAQICMKLEQTHRASVEVLNAAFHDYGCTVLPLFVKVLKRAKKQTEVNESEVEAIGSVIKVLSYFSQADDTRYPMVRQKGMLEALGDIILVKEQIGDEVTETEETKLNLEKKIGAPFPEKTRLHLIGLIANLTCCPENSAIIAADSHFMECLVDLAASDPSVRIREYASFAISKIAERPSTGDISVSSVPGLLKLLYDNAFDISNALLSTFAITTLATLCDRETSVSLVANYDKGCILNILSQAIANEIMLQDEDRSKCAIGLLKICQHVPSSFWKNKDDVMDVLENLASVVVDGQNIKVRRIASEAMKELASHNQSCPEFLDALVTASKTKDPSCKCYIAEALQSHSKVGYRRAMAEKVHVMNALVEMASLDDDGFDACISQTRDAAVSAIVKVASKASNQKLLAKNQRLIIALVKIVSQESEDNRKYSGTNIEAAQGLPSDTKKDNNLYTKTKMTLLNLISNL